jgi:hypothetical protein
MIISASYKTDIPAFYSDWFMHRLRAGYCKMVNPYGRQIYQVDLTRPAVDGFVFWTKNAGPFLHHLAEVHQRGYPFIMQYAINGYPRSLEFSVVDDRRSVDQIRLLCQTYGPKVAVWRYDPVVFSSLTPFDFHVQNFARLAHALQGTTDEVVISFAQIYRKTKRNMDWAAREFAFTWDDPVDQVKHDLTTQLARIAQSYGMQVSICSQRQLLVPGVQDARCVDSVRLEAIAGRPIVARKKGNRPDCGCFVSRDIGEYDTCPHGCVYCYAVHQRDLARRRYKEHDPAGEFLFTPPGYSADADQSATGPGQITQETMF